MDAWRTIESPVTATPRPGKALPVMPMSQELLFHDVIARAETGAVVLQVPVGRIEKSLPGSDPVPGSGALDEGAVSVAFHETGSPPDTVSADTGLQVDQDAGLPNSSQPLGPVTAIGHPLQHLLMTSPQREMPAPANSWPRDAASDGMRAGSQQASIVRVMPSMEISRAQITADDPGGSSAAIGRPHAQDLQPVVAKGLAAPADDVSSPRSAASVPHSASQMPAALVRPVVGDGQTESVGSQQVRHPLGAPLIDFARGQIAADAPGGASAAIGTPHAQDMQPVAAKGLVAPPDDVSVPHSASQTPAALVRPVVGDGQTESVGSQQVRHPLGAPPIDFARGQIAADALGGASAAIGRPHAQDMQPVAAKGLVTPPDDPSSPRSAASVPHSASQMPAALVRPVAGNGPSEWVGSPKYEPAGPSADMPVAPRPPVRDLFAANAMPAHVPTLFARAIPSGPGSGPRPDVGEFAGAHIPASIRVAPDAAMGFRLQSVSIWDGPEMPPDQVADRAATQGEPPFRIGPATPSAQASGVSVLPSAFSEGRAMTLFPLQAHLEFEGAEPLRALIEEAGVPAAARADPVRSVWGPAPLVVRVDRLGAELQAVVIDSLRDARQRLIQIQIDPVELGRVRIMLHMTESGLHVQIMAERPETLDLMRRFSADLMQDMEQMGFSDLLMSFSDEQDRALPANPERLAFAREDGTAESVRSIGSGRIGGGDEVGGMDLRL